MKRISMIVLLTMASAGAAFAQGAAQTNPLRRPATSAPAATAVAATAADPAPAKTGAKRKSTKVKSTGDFAERRKRCSGEWAAAKAANSTAGQKWPQFFSACNTRLKAAGV